MKMKDYIPASDDSFDEWQSNFLTEITAAEPDLSDFTPEEAAEWRSLHAGVMQLLLER